MSKFLETSVWKPDIFRNKVVFVTGGAGTICRVQTEALVLLGCDAVIVGRQVDKTERAAREIAELRPNAKVLGIGNIDVRKVQDLVSAVNTAVKELGKIDFVIAGAAGNFISDVNHLSANAFKSVVEIDLIGSFNTFKATFDQLRQNKGAIIFVSATLHYQGLPLQAHASAAKAGIDSLSRTLAVELGPLGIRSNAIAPGGIENTEGLSRLVPKHLVESLREAVPLQRFGTATDIANATVFLFSPAGSYINGETLVVDGGAWQTSQLNSSPPLYPGEVKLRNSGNGKL